MAEVTAKMVQELREATNVSMMECKRALVEAEGNMEKANRILRERGMAVAAKKASRTANQGLIASAASADGKTASLIEVNSETDFVARNEGFKAFVETLAKRALTTDGNLADEVTAEVTAKVAEIGENIVVRRNVRFAVGGAGKVGAYIHGGKVGVLVELGCTKEATVASETFLELLRDLTLHVAACSPRYLTSAEIPADVVTAEREIYAKQVTDKPANVIDKIVDGKVRKFFSEVCFVDQLFVKEQKMTVTQILEQKGKALGDKLSIRRFVRYQLGA